MPVLRPSVLIPIIALAVALWSVVLLERARGAVGIEEVLFQETPATIYTGEADTGLLVIVSHGFAGSRQMMEAISLTLARAGHTVVAFDYYGHGRHETPLSPAVETVTGTTEDLVRQTLAVVSAAQARTGLTRVALVGHSMATDVIVRAAARLPATEAVVAISMYSEAVSASHPERLLIVSGATEGRLRDVALDVVAQIRPAGEGETVTGNGVIRRAVSAPWVGHVGVLWAPLTLTEIAGWLGGRVAPALTGPWIAALLVSIVVLFRPLAARLPATDAPARPDLRRRAMAAASAALVTGGVAVTGLPLFGLAGFGALGLAFGLWGATVLAILRPRMRLTGPDLAGAALLIAWGLGVFAIALDRYGAAFLPTGPRLPLMLALLPATLLFALADRALVAGRGLLARIGLRVPFLLALLLAMTLGPAQLGLAFTVLPVLVLFWLVYGTMARWVSARTGPVGAGLGAGVILAWAVAASTPLFQA
ncbi:Serine aminopeptidase, S33 [Roseivivax lentus]|uniref:Serine aminopeptidase, S33 n=1 Tax=Roseivivax lentus TaxID=633194 RepID=A0A1N7LTI2_9RHOB|nr:alpha/beta fold hydrolase [Roseivivax lentus]SIS77163.1 Serine aminopeptidase, S33 [Roseivivax lentus]